jgi:WD40 repeat protein
MAETKAATRADREKCFELYSAHQAVVSSVAAHPFGRAFFSGDWSGSLYAWLPYDQDDFGGEYDRNLFTGQFYAAPGTFIKAERTADRGITDITLTDSGEQLALGTQDGFVEMWRVRGFERFARKQLHMGPVLSVSLSPKGTRVASAGKDGVVHISTLVDDPKFGITTDATRQMFVEISSYRVPGARLVKYISEDKAVVGTTDGVMVELDASASIPTPTPTGTPTAEKVLDTDY